LSTEVPEYQIPPISFELDGCLVTIYEVTRVELINGEKWYLVHLDIEYRGRRTRRFTLTARNTDELKKKLLVEISKLKLAHLSGVTP